MSRRAGFWIRVAASLIDATLLLALVFAQAATLDAVWYRTYDIYRAQAAAAIVFYGGWLLYSSLEIWIAATVGKLLLGLRIARIDGLPADRWRLFLRWQTKHLPFIASLMFELTMFTGFAALAGFMNVIIPVGCLFALNDDHLTWHDQWARTAVFRKPRLPPPVRPPLPGVGGPAS